MEPSHPANIQPFSRLSLQPDVPVALFGSHAARRSLAHRPHLGVFFPFRPLHHQNTDILYQYYLFFNCRSVLLDPAAPWPTDGILYWLGLVIADHIPASPDVLALFLIVSAAVLFVLLVLALITSLHCQHSFRNQTTGMDSNEMTISCKQLCDGAADTCPPYDDRTAPPMDVDMEEGGENGDSMESCRNSEERAVGLPFPGALLADGTFAVEYHDM
jgi:hypothetical protein